VLLTPAWIKRLKPGPRPVEYRDIGQRGLTLRLETSGRLTWVTRYWLNGRHRRFVLGTFPEVKLKTARERARDALAQRDPQAEKEKRRAGETIARNVEAWLGDQKQGPAARWKGGVDGGTARSFLPHVRAFVAAFGERKLGELTTKDLERFISEPDAAATRNRRLQALRFLLSWAKRRGLIEADPTAGLGRERETERARTLTDDELRALVHGFDGTRYGRAVRLLTLTGLRRDEVLGARWSWLDSDAGVLTIPPEAEKAGRSRGEPRRVALSPTAVALLADQRKEQLADQRSEFIFGTETGERPYGDALKARLYVLRGRRANGLPISTRKRRFRKLEREAVLAADVTIHDVRRTVSNALLNRLKVAPWIVDHVVLGHARPKLLRTYMPTLPLDEARDALARWAAELARILGESTTRADAQ
jgi:integrase